MDDNTVIQYLENRLNKNPKSLLFARLADNYIARGRIDEAIILCKSGIKYHPDYITGYLILSKAFLIKEDYEKAETELKRVLSRDRHYIAAHKYLADLMLKMGWENTAAMHYKDILKIDPLNAEASEKLSELNVPDMPSPVEELHIEPDFLEEEPSEDRIRDERQNDDLLLDELEEVFNSSETNIKEQESPSFWPEETLQEKSEEELSEEPASDTTDSDLLDDIELVNEEVHDEALLENENNLSTAIESVFKDVKPITESKELQEEPSEESPEDKAAEERAEAQYEEIAEAPANSPEKEEKEDSFETLLEDLSDMPDFISSEDTLPVDLKISSTPSADTNAVATSEASQSVTEETPATGSVEATLSGQSSEEERISIDINDTDLEESENINVTDKQTDTIEPLGLEEPETEEAPEKPQGISESPAEKDDTQHDSSLDFEPQISNNGSIAEKTDQDEPEDDEETLHSSEKFEIDNFSDTLIKEADEASDAEETKEINETLKEDDFDFSLEILEEIDRHIEEASQAAKNSMRSTDETGMSGIQEKDTSIEAETSGRPFDEETEKQAADFQPEPDQEKPSGKESKIVSPTLGEIYIAQGEYAKAIKVYEILLDKNPQEIRYQNKIDELKHKLDSAV